MKKFQSNVFFFYDDLMTKRMQDLLRLDTKFLSYGFLKGKLYSIYDRRNSKRVYAIKPNQIRKHRGNNKVFGAIFLVKNATEFLNAIHGFYYNSETITNEVFSTDLFIKVREEITPIVFNNLSEIEKHSYTKLSPIMCQTFLGNVENPLIQKRSYNGKLHRIMHGVDNGNFLLSLLEQRGGYNQRSK